MNTTAQGAAMESDLAERAYSADVGIQIYLYRTSARDTSVLTFFGSPSSGFCYIRNLSPTITSFSVLRCDANGNVNDQGTHALVSCAASMLSSATYAGEQTATIQWKETNADNYAATDAVSIPVADLLAGIAGDSALLASHTFSGGAAYDFKLSFGDTYQLAQSMFRVPKVHANLHLAPSKYGVGIGQMSSGTEESPKFECQYPAYFYGGIALGALPMQCGSVAFSVGGSASTTVSVTFATAFAATPIVCATVAGTGMGNATPTTCLIESATASGCVIRVSNHHTVARSGYVNWMAMGS